MKCFSAAETATKSAISTRRVNILCANGRISGAQKADSYWIIPEDAKKLKDARIKSEKYIKHKVTHDVNQVEADDEIHS